jgi:hypothetical protein
MPQNLSKVLLLNIDAEKASVVLAYSGFYRLLDMTSKKVEIKPLPPSVEEDYLTSKHEIDKMLDALNNHDVPNDSAAN